MSDDINDENVIQRLLDMAVACGKLKDPEEFGVRKVVAEMILKRIEEGGEKISNIQRVAEVGQIIGEVVETLARLLCTQITVSGKGTDRKKCDEMLKIVFCEIEKEFRHAQGDITEDDRKMCSSARPLGQHAH